MRFASLLTVLATGLSAPALAADTVYPTKSIRFVVPYAPGGSSDVIARILGVKAGELLGQTFVIDNRPGAGSMLGTDLVAKSPGDGYTIVLSDMPHTINPSIYAKVPYDPVKDFTPVTLVGTSAMFLFVNPSTPFQTVKDLIAAAKAAPGKFAIGSGGNGTTTHLSAEIFMQRAGIKLTHVPYKGAGPAMTEVIAGQIPMTFTSMATAAPHVKSGKVRALGVTARKRVPSYPDIPTFQEAGVPDFIVEHWWGVLAPAGVQKPVLDTLRGALVKVIISADTRERFAVLAVEPTTNTPDDFRKLLASDVQHWAKVVKDAGIQPN